MDAILGAMNLINQNQPDFETETSLDSSQQAQSNTGYILYQYKTLKE